MYNEHKHAGRHTKRLLKSIDMALNESSSHQSSSLDLALATDSGAREARPGFRGRPVGVRLVPVLELLGPLEHGRVRPRLGRGRRHLRV